MPFSALVNGKILNTLIDEVPLNPEIRCKHCEEEMLLIAGEVKQKHFRHKAQGNCVVHKPESKEHLALKAAVLQKALEFSSARSGQTEVLIQDGAQRFEADVLLPKNLAVECQVSSCPPEYISSKNEAYRRLGYYPVWIFYTKNEFTQRKSARLNQSARQCFLPEVRKWAADNIGLRPFAFLYLPDKDMLAIPVFQRKKVDDKFSQTGYHNEYFLNEETRYFTWLEFFDYIFFYSECVSR